MVILLRIRKCQCRGPHIIFPAHLGHSKARLPPMELQGNGLEANLNRRLANSMMYLHLDQMVLDLDLQ